MYMPANASTHGFTQTQMHANTHTHTHTHTHTNATVIKGIDSVIKGKLGLS